MPYTDPHNCDCDVGTSNNQTLQEIRVRLMGRLGYGAQAANPPPSMTALLNDMIVNAQRMLYRRLTEMGWIRFFNWPLQAGVYLYDLPDNDDTCTRKIDPLKVQWVGVKINDVVLPLRQGIPPELYTHDIEAQWPQRYEIRQCIEIWPKPSATGGYLTIKGAFGLDPLAANSDRTTVDSELVYMQALANAKAHYRQPDSQLVQQQVEVMLRDIVAGTHQTARYIPGRRLEDACAYALDWPVADPPFPP